MDKIKIGIAGLNRGAAYAKIFSYCEHSKVTAVCDTDQSILAGIQKQIDFADACCYTDFDEFLSADIDAVVISTPTPLHEEHVIKALKAGKHVFSEVNMASTIQGCMNIYEAVKASGKKYMLAENFLYMNYISEWKDLVDRDHIGRIHYAEAEYIEDIRDQLDSWRVAQSPIQYCTHCLAPLMHLIGKDDYIVKATAWGNRSTLAPQLMPASVNMQCAMFETKQGRFLKVLRSQATPRSLHVTYNVYGTLGSLETGRSMGYTTEGMRFFQNVWPRSAPVLCDATRWDAPLEVKKMSALGTADYDCARAFLDAIRFDQEPELNVDRALELTLPGLVAHEAAMQGHIWLDVPHVESLRGLN